MYVMITNTTKIIKKNPSKTLKEKNELKTYYKNITKILQKCYKNDIISKKCHI